MIFAEAFFRPSLGITAIAASTNCLVHCETMALMIPVFKTFQTNNTGFIDSAVNTLNNLIKKGLLVSCLVITFAQTYLRTFCDSGRVKYSAGLIF